MSSGERLFRRLTGRDRGFSAHDTLSYGATGAVIRISKISGQSLPVR